MKTYLNLYYLLKNLKNLLSLIRIKIYLYYAEKKYYRLS